MPCCGVIKVFQRVFSLVGGLISALHLLCVPSAHTAIAAPPVREVRVGVIASGPMERWGLIEGAVRAGLHDHGYTEGKNLVLVKRFVLHPGVPVAGLKEMDEAVRSLLDANVEVVVSGCGWSLRSMMKVTPTVPIIMASVTDPIGQGFIASLARPGGSITGVTGGAGGLGPKMLEQLRAALPEVRIVGVVYNAANSAHQSRFDEVDAAAKAMNVRAVPIDLRALADVKSVGAILNATRVEALLILPDDGLFWAFVDRIVTVSEALRLPTIFPRRDLVEMGGTMSYGADDSEIFRRTGRYVDRILKGRGPQIFPWSIRSRRSSSSA